MQVIFINDDDVWRWAIESDVEQVVGFISREKKHKA